MTINASTLETLRCALVFTAALGFSTSLTAAWVVTLVL